MRKQIMFALKNIKTEQECTFDDEAAEKEFLANSKDAADWKRPNAKAASKPDAAPVEAESAPAAAPAPAAPARAKKK